MKRIFCLLLAVIFFFPLSQVKADTPEAVFGKVVPPPAVAALGFGATGISRVLSNLVTIIFSAAMVVFLLMVVFSGFQWITSGGEKENIAKARGRLTWAVVGIVILALAFVFLRVIGQITGFTFFAGG